MNDNTFTPLGVPSRCGQYVSSSIVISGRCWGCQTNGCLRDICFGDTGLARIWIRRTDLEKHEQHR